MIKRLFYFLVDGAGEFWQLAEMNLRKKAILLVLLAIAIVSIYDYGVSAAWLFALAPIAFIQNMFFTLVSRSRNSQDPDYHRYCAWGSNGVWFVCQVMIVKNVWTAIHAGQWWYAALAALVYTVATTEGSVLMMKRLIKTERGKRRVGANEKIERLEDRIEYLESFNMATHPVQHKTFVFNKNYDFNKEMKGGE